VLSWGEVNIGDATAEAQLLWQADAPLAGFQFECLEGTFIDAGGGDVEALGWSVYLEENMVLAFTLDSAYVPAVDTPIHLITVTVPLVMGQLVLVNPIFADPDAEQILVSGPGALDLLDQCPADVSGDGMVGVDDILTVLDSWGVGDGGDATGDGTTDVNDILAVIGAWGPCS
jgi:hypothetical protein